MRNIKPTRFELAVLVIAAGIISYQLFVPPLLGLADSGDFGRIIPWRGLTHVSNSYEQNYFSYFNSKYRIIERWEGPDWYKTSTSLLIELARSISKVISRDQIFDIRILAAINAVIFIFGLLLILTASRSLATSLRITLFFLLVLVFTDPGYIAYFNSFYSEATALSFLAVGVGSSLILLTNRSSGVVPLAGYFLSIGILITSKPQYIPLVPALGLFGIYLAKGLRYKWKYWLSGSLAVAVCSLGVWYLSQAPPVLKVQSAYIQIFMDLLPNSATPRQDLSEMGLNPDLESFTGTTPYQPNNPLNSAQFQAEFSNKVTPLTVPAFYLSHPDRLYELLERCSKQAFTLRVGRLGYYEASTGRKPLSKPAGIWSSIRENVFPRSVLFLAFFVATGIAAASMIRISSKSAKYLCVFYLLLIFVAAVQFFVPVLAGGGGQDLEKHLFMFNLAFDVCFVLCVLWAVSTLQTFLKTRTADRSGVVELAEG